jgi:septal ring factor EnvC (AmiA/AmiB activator)
VHSQNKLNLAKIKDEIRRLEADLHAKEARETTLLEQLEDLDRKIGLQQKLMSALRTQESEKENAIQITEGRLADAVQSLAKQRELVARRMVAMYKKGSMAEWEALASMKSINQALVWIKYQKMILKNDRRNLNSLAEKETAVHRQKTELQNDLAEKQKLLEEVRSETVLLEDNKRERKKLLAVVRKEKEPLMERLEQKRIAYQEIESWIAREEEKRKAEEIERRKKPLTERTRAPLPPEKFNDQIGWPVRGRIVTPYGRQMDKQLRIWTDNFGIEIETGENNSVCAAADGQVLKVDWQRGMGNLVLLDHGGVYTVYAHLEEVFVNLGEMVRAGKPIGKVGDHTGFYGSTLHFEVWKGKTPFDPEEWLK